jgi:hypothetical protein
MKYSGTLGLAIAVLVTFAAACEGGGPTTPTGGPTTRAGPPSSPNREAFKVTRIVTDEQGAPGGG